MSNQLLMWGQKVKYGALLILTADSTVITADSSKSVMVDEINTTIMAAFDAMNAKFTELYTLAGL